MYNLALFEPELASNVGSIIRTCSCFNVNLFIIKPVGFIWNENKLKHSALDYYNKINIYFFNSFEEFKNNYKGRIILTNCQKGIHYKKFNYIENDCVLMGKESSGLPEYIYNNYNFDSINIPIKERSLNLAIASAILISQITT